MVIASDGGDPPKSGSMVVSIKVDDVNDNVPIFENSTYEVVSVVTLTVTSASCFYSILVFLVLVFK